MAMEVRMGNLMKMEDREIKKNHYGVIDKKILEIKKRISDESYLDDAISKIATDLSHYLTRK